MVTTTKTRSVLKEKIVDAAIPFGASDMTVRANETEVRIVTPTERAMSGVCRKLMEDKEIMYKVRVDNDGLRTVILKPSDNEGTKWFKELAEDLGDTQ